MRLFDFLILQEHGIELRTGVSVKSVDTVGKKVHLEDGGEIQYTRLLVASGSK